MRTGRIVLQRLVYQGPALLVDWDTKAHSSLSFDRRKADVVQGCKEEGRREEIDATDVKIGILECLNPYCTGDSQQGQRGTLSH